MIAIPTDCPESIKQEIGAAFGLFWCDYAACLNRIRQAIELFLTTQGFPSTKHNSEGKIVRQPLPGRIAELVQCRPGKADLFNRLLALKYLGDAGSHPGKIVKAEDVFDSLDILERVLHETYTDHESLLAKTVNEIIQRKGPRRSKK
jgi:hypothetical protein